MNPQQPSCQPSLYAFGINDPNHTEYVSKCGVDNVKFGEKYVHNKKTSAKIFYIERENGEIHRIAAESKTCPQQFYLNDYCVSSIDHRKVSALTDETVAQLVAPIYNDGEGGDTISLRSLTIHIGSGDVIQMGPTSDPILDSDVLVLQPGNPSQYIVNKNRYFGNVRSLIYPFYVESSSWFTGQPLFTLFYRESPSSAELIELESGKIHIETIDDDSCCRYYNVCTPVEYVLVYPFVILFYGLAMFLMGLLCNLPSFFCSRSDGWNRGKIVTVKVKVPPAPIKAIRNQTENQTLLNCKIDT